MLSYVWLVLVVLTILEAADELFGIIGPVWIYAVWVHDLILLTCTVLVLGRTTFEPTTRRAWLAFGMALAVWCIGSIAWSVAYGARAVAPYPTFADIFWLLWYPLMAVGIYYLIRVRVPQFELHRWMDGIAATLVVLAVGFALVVQPAAEHTSQSLLATMVDFTYPVLDVLLIGAILGVYGLLGWRPDTMWLLVGLSVLTMSVADAVSAVQEAHSVVNDNHYAFMWTVGALLIALAAWVRTPGAADRRRTGHRDAGHRPGSLRPGPGHGHPDLRRLPGGGKERADRDGGGTGGGLGADHSHSAPRRVVRSRAATVIPAPAARG